MLNMIKLDWLGMKYYWVRIIIIPLSIYFMGFFNEVLIIPFLSFLCFHFQSIHSRWRKRESSTICI